ncbi:hypothetical protein KKJ17_18725 [Xenorhabdus bovienii]|uniref:hypothetical protein n=1 Tax=Xenorhabdus bovienii TaxID=40576 RepID=UPI0023B30ABF|nr:hypothetical protein [Xenorhabdus bovienii]MDE9519695.1 hypothetical protein [Xenorhabdus bovienii]MDE9565955.1 hypothetical protein [Xenorhabdus bovienii]
MDFSIPDTGTVISIIAIIASYFNGVRVGKVNDRRKEFNAVADKVNLKILKIIRELDSSMYPSFSISQDEIDHLLIHIDKGKRKSLQEAYDTYVQIIHEHQSVVWDGKRIQDDSFQKLKLTLKELLTFVERK